MILLANIFDIFVNGFTHQILVGIYETNHICLQLLSEKIDSDCSRLKYCLVMSFELWDIRDSFLDPHCHWFIFCLSPSCFVEKYSCIIKKTTVNKSDF